jgi:predicted phosphodiesterase
MTRIAVLSDIHGNLGALDAVLADIESRGADQIVNLGDICSGALLPLPGLHSPRSGAPSTPETS